MVQQPAEQLDVAQRPEPPVERFELRSWPIDKLHVIYRVGRVFTGAAGHLGDLVIDPVHQRDPRTPNDPQQRDELWQDVIDVAMPQVLHLAVATRRSSHRPVLPNGVLEQVWKGDMQCQNLAFSPLRMETDVVEAKRAWSFSSYGVRVPTQGLPECFQASQS